MRQTMEGFDEEEAGKMDPMAGFVPPEPSEPTSQPFLADFKRFPVDCFPQPVCDYVQSQARELDCDEAAVALPALAALAASIGSTRRIRLKRAWTEPSVLWTAVVADNAARHTAGLDAAVGPLRALQARELPWIDTMMGDFRRKLVDHRASFRSGEYHSVGTPPRRPARPVVKRYLSSDWNAKSVLRLLAGQPRGLLVCCEALDGWLGRSNSARSRGSMDVAHWLELHAGRSLVVEGRTVHQMPTPLPQPCVSVTGTIQAETLVQKLTKTKSGARAGEWPAPCGLLSRLLFAFPPPRPRRWTDDEVETPVIEGYEAVMEKLVALQLGHPAGDDPPADGINEPGSGVDRKVEGSSDRPVITTPPKPPEQRTFSGWLCGAPATIDERRFERCRVAAKEYLNQLSEESRAKFLSRFVNRPNADGKTPEEAMVEQVACRIYTLPNGGCYEDDEPERPNHETVDSPVLVELSPEAKTRFASFVHEFGREQVDVDDALAASCVHWEACAARLALVLHLTRWAAGESVDPAICDLTSMERGITLARWFANEARRVHALLCESPDQCDRRKLIEWLGRRGGQASSRDLCRANGRKYSTMESAEMALKRLADEGVGTWVSQPAGELGGRPWGLLI